MNNAGGELIKSKVKADRSLRERLQPRLGLLEIGRVTALGTPGVDLSQQVGPVRTRLSPAAMEL